MTFAIFAGSHDAGLFTEIGAAIIVLALLARLASRWGFSAIPLYLLVGLAFGNALSATERS
jgi:CPA2 family monovalent cation:H+ antiporter-2